MLELFSTVLCFSLTENDDMVISKWHLGIIVGFSRTIQVGSEMELNAFISISNVSVVYNIQLKFWPNYLNSKSIKEKSLML